MTAIERVRELLLTGLTPTQIQHEIGNLTISTVKAYIARVQTGLTSAEKDQVRERRAQNPVAQTRSHAAYHQRFVDREIVSRVHARIGRKLTLYRIEHQLKASEVAERNSLGNRQVISAMELGFHDFTLTEIGIISEMLDMTTEQLLKIVNDEERNDRSGKKLLRPDSRPLPPPGRGKTKRPKGATAGHS